MNQQEHMDLLYNEIMKELDSKELDSKGEYSPCILGGLGYLTRYRPDLAVLFLQLVHKKITIDRDTFRR